MKELILRNISKTYQLRAGSREVLESIDLRIPSGQFLVILGPSGCGKTTLLKIIAGLVAPDDGDYQLTIDGKDIVAPGPDRNIVFQAYMSFPWLTSIENVRFGLQFLQLPKSEQYRRADAYLAKVGLSEFRDDYPKNLSGGQQQRLAIARTLAAEPDIILMDEPFAALDSQTREAMQEDLLEIWRTSGRTILFVTHDIAEAAFLGERVLILTRKPARIVEEFDSLAELKGAIEARINPIATSGVSATATAVTATPEPMSRINSIRNEPDFLTILKKLRVAVAKHNLEPKPMR